MFDIGWSELVLIGAVALVVIGPKDLPKVMRVMGQWVGKARRFAHEMHLQMEQLSYETEIAEKLKAEAVAKPFAHDQEQTQPSPERKS